MFLYDGGIYTTYDGLDPKVVNALPAGIYRTSVRNGASMFLPAMLEHDKLVDIESRVARTIRREIDLFFDAAVTRRLDACGIRHRRGIIIYGEPGSGKTSLIRSLLPRMVERNAVVLLEVNADHLEPYVIPAIRQHDTDRTIVLVWDEFEKNIEYSRNELLQLLDGMSSPDHLLTIGTTNVIEKVPAQFRDRPSRFSLVVEMPPLDMQQRATYARSKYGMLGVETIQDIVRIVGTERPLDFLEDACKLSLMGYDVDEIAERVNGEDRLKLDAIIDDDEEEDDD